MKIESFPIRRHRTGLTLILLGIIICPLIYYTHYNGGTVSVPVNPADPTVAAAPQASAMIRQQLGINHQVKDTLPDNQAGNLGSNETKEGGSTDTHQSVIPPSPNVDNAKPQAVSVHNPQPQAVPTENVKPNEVPTENVKPNEVPTENVKPNEVPTENVKPKEVSTENTEPKELPTENTEPKEVPTGNTELKGVLGLNHGPMIAVAPGWICNAGRLGNKMYMIASTFITAMRLNATFVSASDGCEWPAILKDTFTQFRDNVKLVPTSTLRTWKLVKEKAFTEFEPILAHNGQSIIVDGFRQTWRYFDKDHEIQALRELFHFTPKYEASAVRDLGKVKEQFKSIKDPIFVGIHIRQGDVWKPGPKQFGYQAANTSFYQAAMRKMTIKLKNSSSIIFVAASDSPNIGKSLLSELTKTFNVAWLTGNAYEDFAALSKCNHTIISGGTFGFWAAWLSPGETIYFSQFARAGSQFEKEYNKANFFLPTWTPVAWS